MTSRRDRHFWFIKFWQTRTSVDSSIRATTDDDDGAVAMRRLIKSLESTRTSEPLVEIRSSNTISARQSIASLVLARWLTGVKSPRTEREIRAANRFIITSNLPAPFDFLLLGKISRERLIRAKLRGKVLLPWPLFLLGFDLLISFVTHPSFSGRRKQPQITRHYRAITD